MCTETHTYCYLYSLKKREKHPWTNVTFSTKSNILQWVFFMIFKSCKWYQIAQSVTYEEELICLTIICPSPEHS